MKTIFVLLATILLGNSSAVAYVCPLDLYFRKTFDYRTYQIKSFQTEMERLDNNYSFLPELSLSTGQSAYNKSGFKSLNTAMPAFIFLCLFILEVDIF